jgi:hypothetical protein
MDEPESDYDPGSYDSIIIKTVIQDSFPCLHDFLKDSLLNPNMFSQYAMLRLFGVEAYNHLTFDVDWTTDNNSPAVAYTTPGTREFDNNENMHFYDTIRFNPYYLRNATKEVFVQSVMHESIHAYINWCILSYNNGANGIDSNYLKEHFPLHWEWLANRTYPSDYQHNLMVNNYLNTIREPIMQFGNKNAPLELRQFVATSIALSGLETTSYWQTLPNKCIINAVNWWSQNYNLPSNVTANLPGCGFYPSSFRDSLQFRGLCQ